MFWHWNRHILPLSCHIMNLKVRWKVHWISHPHAIFIFPFFLNNTTFRRRVLDHVNANLLGIWKGMMLGIYHSCQLEECQCIWQFLGQINRHLLVQYRNTILSIPFFETLNDSSIKQAQTWRCILWKENDIYVAVHVNQWSRMD